MSDDRKLTLYHSPNTRSTAVLLLLEAIGAPYELKLVNQKKGEQNSPEHLAINPMGKVPALVHGDAVITETVACFIYLADLFPKAGLAPGASHPMRGPYLRWMIYYAACFEPAVVDRALQREPGARGISPYADFDTVMKTINGQLAKGPFLLGDKLSAADILWGSGLNWTTSFKLVPMSPEIKAFLGRLGQSAVLGKVKQMDAEFARKLEG